ncbi:MAG: PHP domain-containing protein, partial [Patescibacteria group bacterium]
KGLIALSACMSGEIPRAVFRKDFEAAERLVAEYKEIFGPDNFFIEVSHHPNIPHHPEIQKGLRELAAKTGTPMAATQDIHYIKPEDATAQDVLLAVQTNTKLDDEDRLTMKSDDFSLRAPDHMRELFRDFPEAADNTVKIAERCNVEIQLGVLQLPSFDVPGGESVEAYLEKLCAEGMRRRFGEHPPPAAFTRLEY